MEAADHDLMIRVKQAFESFIREVEIHFKQLESQRKEICIEVNDLKAACSKMSERMAVMETNLSHLKEGMSAFKKDISEDLEANQRSIGEWVAITAVIATIIGMVIGFFIPG